MVVTRAAAHEFWPTPPIVCYLLFMLNKMDMGLFVLFQDCLILTAMTSDIHPCGLLTNRNSLP